jgi:FMN phosphatase YigB (HAD superfamily)
MGPSAGRYEVVLFDFHGVLCLDLFYTTLYEHFPRARDFVETSIFGGDSVVVRQWLRGELASGDVNRLISQSAGVNLDDVNRLFNQGVAEMRVDSRLIDLASRLAADGVRVGIVTDNMDVFSGITVPRLSLNEVFPAIVNSADFGFLKLERNGLLFKVALERLGREGDFASALLVDDSAGARAMFRRKGGDAFPYLRFDVFARWADANLARPAEHGARAASR